MLISVTACLSILSEHLKRTKSSNYRTIYNLTQCYICPDNVLINKANVISCVIVKINAGQSVDARDSWTETKSLDTEIRVNWSIV